MKSFRTILPFLRAHLWKYIFGILSLIWVDIASLLTPQVFKRFADWAQVGELTHARALWAAAVTLGLGIAVAVGRFGWRMNIFGTARKLEYWLRDLLFGKYLSLDDQFFTKHRTGDLMANVSNDVLMVRNTMGGGILMVFDSIFMSFLTVFLMIYTVGLKTALMGLLALPFLGILVYLMAKPLQKRSRDVQDTFSDLTIEVQENISGIGSIKAFVIEENRFHSFNQVNEKYRKDNMALVKISAIFDPMIGLISGIAFVIFILYSINEMVMGRMSLGDFIAVSTYINMMIWPLIAMGMVVSNFQRGIAAMSRINEVLSAKAKVTEPQHTVTPEDTYTTITFRDVWFRYGEDLPWVLEGVSFQVPAHKTVAILGRTGSGKTTILNLLLRRYDVSKGEILLNGVNIKDLSFDEIYSRMAYVEQESFLFSRTIAGNIAFSANANYDKARVEEAAQFSQVHGDIEAMPEGYQTWVGERGVTLSGGQKQRVSIARAYYQEAEVLILDDSLSAVDTNTEKRIIEQLDQFKRSLIIVSQRVSTVKEADEILVLHEGKISQRGNHSSLMADQDGFYKNLYERQLLELELDETEV